MSQSSIIWQDREVFWRFDHQAQKFIAESQGEILLELAATGSFPASSGFLVLNDRRVPYHVSATSRQLWVTVNGCTRTFPLSVGRPRRKGSALSLDEAFEAPMTGTILSVGVIPGQEIAAGTTVVTLTAMKMEHKLVAPVPCRIETVLCAEGALVQQGQLLIKALPQTSA
jgi:acetyl/propionyl-CoA carboxylase alpha subunit